MKKYSTIILLLIIYAKLSGQDFVANPLITIPGDNKNFSVVSPFVFGGYEDKSFICWENKSDSTYTIYLKRIDTLSNKIYTVVSDSNQNINPSIAYTDSGIRIAWQSLRNNYWVIYSRDYNDGLFSEVRLQTDSITNNVTPSIDYRSLVWIQDGKLMCNLYYSQLEIVDSLDCSNPKLLQSFGGDPIIIYEKGMPPNTQIKLAQYAGQSGQNKVYWRITQISDSGYNINPSFGIDNNISYQTMVNNKWKIVYSFKEFWDENNNALKTNNISCNYEHPIVFSHPIPAYKSVNKANTSEYSGEFFVAYDSDSLINNKEIFVYSSYTPFTQDTVINISNTEGDDIKPLVAVLRTTVPKIYKMFILWEHRDNNKTDIWQAVTQFYLSLSDINEDQINKSDYSLSQNFPNPFNPTTKIKYTIPTSPLNPSPYQGEGHRERLISLKVYDILGNEVATLVNEEQSPGNYEVEFDASKYNLCSGIYYYVLNAGNIRLIQKMCLIK